MRKVTLTVCMPVIRDSYTQIDVGRGESSKACYAEVLLSFFKLKQVGRCKDFILYINTECIH